MRVGIVSAKGSPGATTVALGIAAATGGIAVELDPSGGDVECWVGPSGEPGLIRVASALRHAVDPVGLLAEHAREVQPGVRVVLAPAGADQASSTLVAIGDRLAAALDVEDCWVALDAGRWSRAQPAASRLAGCDAMVVVLAPTLAGVAHARSLVGPLRDLYAVPVVGVVNGEHGYRPDEIASELGIEVVGPVAWDPRGAQALVTNGVSGWWRRSSFARSVRSLVDALDAFDSLPVHEEVASRA